LEELKLAVTSVVKLSELEGAHRLNAEYYQPEYLSLDQNIRKFKFYLLGQIITRFSSGENLPQLEYYPTGKPYIRTQNVRPIHIDKDGLRCVTPLCKNLPLTEEGDLLFVRVGEGVGNTSIVTPDWVGSSYSDNVIRISIKQLDPYFVIIFLNSRLGRKCLERVKKGSARSLISRENIDLIKIFEPSPALAEYCKNVIKEAQKIIVSSESLYSQAENLLLEGLGLKDFCPNYELSYVASLSKAFGVHRVDAEYFQPTYENLVKHLTEVGEVKPLRYFLLDIKRGIEVGGEQYQEEGKPFIRVSNISVTGLVERDQKYIDETLYAGLAGEYEPKVGELLLTKDATPGVAYIVKEPIQGIIAGGILRLMVDEAKINKEYLALCINSLIGKLQIERDGGGSVIRHWRPEQIKKLVIPLLPSNTQKKIESLVRQSHEARKKAKQLLEEAKRKTEEAIEAT